jgi:hypothetical protein
MNTKHLIILVYIALVPVFAVAQQVADTTFNPVISKSEYEKGKGPVVHIDEGHNNFHTADGRYLPFARLLRADGYRVKGLPGEFSFPIPEEIKILVIANALNKINISNWYLPTPSAFTKSEIEAINKWVTNGGSLFLIADHMPFGGSAGDLAASFGFEFTNGFAADTAVPGPAYFYRKDNGIISSAISDGRYPYEKVNKVVTFTGQAFRAPVKASPILRFDRRYTLLESDTAWVFDKTTKYKNIDGWLQGASLPYGKGRIVCFGEAAMFTAQLAGPNKTRMGMNSAYAEENYKLLLNIIHWLDKEDGEK